MTNEERTLIADVLRERINEISKLFQEGGWVPQENVPHYVKGQFMLLARDLDHAFAKQDGAFEPLFLGTVQREINRSEGRPEPQPQEAEGNPFDKIWGASASEDGFVVAVDPADMKSICKMGREAAANPHLESWSRIEENVGTNDRNDTCERFNRVFWHDSKLRSFQVVRRDDVDDVVLELELRGASELELTPTTLVLQDAVFLFCDIDLQGKRECSDDISSAKCSAQSDLKTKIQDERLKYSPDALVGYSHFSFYLIPPGGTVDVIAAGFRFEGQAKESAHRQERVLQ